MGVVGEAAEIAGCSTTAVSAAVKGGGVTRRTGFPRGCLPRAKVCRVVGQGASSGSGTGRTATRRAGASEGSATRRHRRVADRPNGGDHAWDLDHPGEPAGAQREAPQHHAGSPTMVPPNGHRADCCRSGAPQAGVSDPPRMCRAVASAPVRPPLHVALPRAVLALRPHAKLAVTPHAVDQHLDVGALVGRVDVVFHDFGGKAWGQRYG